MLGLRPSQLGRLAGLLAAEAGPLLPAVHVLIPRGWGVRAGSSEQQGWRERGMQEVS